MKHQRGAECRSCGAPIVFGVTDRERYMPLDKEPSEHGNLVLIRDEYARVDRIMRYDPTMHEGETRYTSHFATCPNATQHRKARSA